MELGINGATTLTADLPTDIKTAGKAGFDFVEIWAGKLLDYLASGGVAGIRRDLRRARVQPLTLNSVEHITFNDPSGQVRKVEEFRRMCQVAASIRCETVLVVPSPRPARTSLRAIERETVRVLRQFSTMAGDSGVRVALEFLGFRDCSVNTLAQCATIVEQVARPNVGLVLDTFHFHAGRSTARSIADVDPDRIFMVHLNDVERAPRDRMHDALRLLPGEGVIPLVRILRELKAIGYDGRFSVEIFRPSYWKRPPQEIARQARAAAVSLLEEAGWANQSAAE
jgi:2-keto-myo-inositol isomerase